MSADNSIARSGRAVDPQAERPEFDIPPEVEARHEVREVGTRGSSDHRIGLFLAGDRENPAIEISDNGDNIVAHREDPETVASLVEIARHNGWDKIAVDGSPEFRKAVWAEATRAGLTVSGYEPTFADRERVENRRREDAARQDEKAAEQASPAARSDIGDGTIPVRPGETGRDGVVREQPVGRGGAALADGDREDRPVAGSAAAQGRQMEPGAPVGEEQERGAAIERRHDSQELAELFLRGGAEVASDPRLANALQAQATMEQHIGVVFDGDASRAASANLESRQMISDVLRRGLDVSVREPAQVRQIEPILTRHDLER